MIFLSFPNSKKYIPVRKFLLSYSQVHSPTNSVGPETTPELLKERPGA